MQSSYTRNLHICTTTFLIDHLAAIILHLSSNLFVCLHHPVNRFFRYAAACLWSRLRYSFRQLIVIIISAPIVDYFYVVRTRVYHNKIND